MEGTLFWIDDAVIPTEVSHLMLGNNFPNTVERQMLQLHIKKAIKKPRSMPSL